MSIKSKNKSKKGMTDAKKKSIHMKTIDGADKDQPATALRNETSQETGIRPQ